MTPDKDIVAALIRTAEYSRSNRKKVACIVARAPENRSGSDIYTNECDYIGINHISPHFGLKMECVKNGKECSRDEVIHAEAAALMMMARLGRRTEGRHIYITYSPCIECAKLIHAAGIAHVFYLKEFPKKQGLRYLKKVEIPHTEIGTEI